MTVEKSPYTGIQGRIVGHTKKGNVRVWLHFYTCFGQCIRRPTRRNRGVWIRTIIAPDGTQLRTDWPEIVTKMVILRDGQFINNSIEFRDRMSAQCKLILLLFAANRKRLYSRLIIRQILAYDPFRTVDVNSITKKSLIPKIPIFNTFRSRALSVLLSLRSSNKASDSILIESKNVRKLAFDMNLHHLKELTWASVCFTYLPSAVDSNKSSVRTECTFANLFVAAKMMYDTVLMETIRILWENYRAASTFYEGDIVVTKKSAESGVVITAKTFEKTDRWLGAEWVCKDTAGAGRGGYTSTRILPPSSNIDSARSDMNKQAKHLNEELSSLIDKIARNTRVKLTVRSSEKHFRMISTNQKHVKNLCSRIRIARVFGTLDRVRHEFGEEFLKLDDIAQKNMGRSSSHTPACVIRSSQKSGHSGCTRCVFGLVYRDGIWEKRKDPDVNITFM